MCLRPPAVAHPGLAMSHAHSPGEGPPHHTPRCPIRSAAPAPALPTTAGLSRRPGSFNPAWAGPCRAGPPWRRASSARTPPHPAPPQPHKRQPPRDRGGQSPLLSVVKIRQDCPGRCGCWALLANGAGSEIRETMAIWGQMASGLARPLARPGRAKVMATATPGSTVHLRQVVQYRYGWCHGPCPWLG